MTHNLTLFKIFSNLLMKNEKNKKKWIIKIAVKTTVHSLITVHFLYNSTKARSLILWITCMASRISFFLNRWQNAENYYRFKMYWMKYGKKKSEDFANDRDKCIKLNGTNILWRHSDWIKHFSPCFNFCYFLCWIQSLITFTVIEIQ